MAMIFSDDRSVPIDLTVFPLNVLLAIDYQFLTLVSPDGFGSGIFIAPSHVLTAGHNGFEATFTVPASNAFRCILCLIFR
jgi:hypothetical protein